jgi:isocitrate dehydrogenase
VRYGVGVKCAGITPTSADDRVQPKARQHQQGKETSTNPIASIFAWTRGLKYRGSFDNTPGVVKFGEALEKGCVETVESGDMTCDLAILIRADRPWLTTNQFLDKLDANLRRAMG